MGIASKNKRKITFRKKKFYWWIKAEFDGSGGMLEVNIASEDKKFLIKYYVVQEQKINRHITVIGSEFPGLERKEGNWKRFICPDFVSTFENHGIGPKNIEYILTWCFDPEKKLIPVNYEGVILE
jgi:hypothetical protein